MPLVTNSLGWRFLQTAVEAAATAKPAAAPTSASPPAPDYFPTVSKTVTVQPYVTETVMLPGRYFYCRSATAAFTLRLGGGDAVSVNAGQSSSAAVFQYLTIQNESAAANAIEFVVSSEPILEQRPTTATVTTTAKDPSTYTKATACAANATTTFSGLDGTLQRKQIIVQNRELSVADGGTGQFIEVTDDTATVKLKLSPLAMLTLVTNGVVKVAVPNGCTAGAVLETFYST